MTTCSKAIWLGPNDVVWCARERNHPNDCAPPSKYKPLVETPRHETSASIAQWQLETFGPATSLRSSVIRAMREFLELDQLLHINDSDPAAVEEIADIAIVLSRIVAAHGRDLQEEIDRKMAVNRVRKWKLTGDGHGQHEESK